MAADADEITRSIATLNLDHTTRAKAVSTQDTLCEGVIYTLSEFAEAPSIISMVEVSGKKWIKSFEAQTKYTGIQSPNGYTRGGTNYIAWDQDLYVCTMNITSHKGRYCGVILEEKDKTVPKKFLHLAVHLPTKGNWELQARQAAQTVDWARLQGVDEVSVAGDFNQRPEQVMGIFGDCGLAASIVSSDNVKTTKKGSCIDNVLLDEHVAVRTVRIQTGNTLFSHHPLSVVALYE